LTELTQEPPRAESLIKTGASRAALAFIFATVLFDTLGFGIIIPVYPQLIAGFVGGNQAQAGVTLGVFNAVWASMQFIFAPVLGALSDRFGRRPVLIISALGLGIDYMIMALAPNLTWLFVGRIVSGITSASFTVSFAYVADVVPDEKRAGAYGLIGSIFGVGFIIGPALGGVLGSIGPRFPFWGAAALSISSAIYGLFVLRESLPIANRRPFSLKTANPVGGLLMIRGRKGLGGLLTVNFLSFLAFQVLPTVYVLYAGYRYGWGPTLVGLALAIVGASNIVVQGLLVRRFVARFGERITLLIGLVSGTAGFVVWGLASTPLIFMIAIIFYAPIGFVQPAMQAFMTRKIGPSEQGALQGINGSVMALTGIIGPLIFGSLYAYFISPQSFNLPGAPFLLAALLMVSSLILAAKVTRSKDQSLDSEDLSNRIESHV
jgi:DHA1 family tetracycline resistance protein-like MFS transporter